MESPLGGLRRQGGPVRNLCIVSHAQLTGPDDSHKYATETFRKGTAHKAVGRTGQVLTPEQLMAMESATRSQSLIDHRACSSFGVTMKSPATSRLRKRYSSACLPYWESTLVRLLIRVRFRSMPNCPYMLG
jgi:hypothetical protein